MSSRRLEGTLNVVVIVVVVGVVVVVVVVVDGGGGGCCCWWWWCYPCTHMIIKEAPLVQSVWDEVAIVGGGLGPLGNTFNAIVCHDGFPGRSWLD